MRQVKGIEIDTMVEHYLICELWSGVIPESDEENSELIPIEDNYGLDDISVDALQKAVKDCNNFREYCKSCSPKLGDLLEGYPEEQAGHDFSLTRNGHGAGFWDRGQEYTTEEKEHALTDAAHTFGSTYWYVNNGELGYD